MQEQQTSSTDEQAPATFESLGLCPETLQTLKTVGYEKPSPIQARFIPIAVTGRDCIGQARTGTGKTAAFVLPMLELVNQNAREVQVLVLSPTRELSEQVGEEAKRLAQNSNLRLITAVGGRPIDRQIRALQKGVTVVVGTPGRVLDLMRRRELDLSKLKIIVLDEADRMLDIGFRPDIERILKASPSTRQTMLLSATLPPPVEHLAKRFMTNPEFVDLSEDKVAVDTIEMFYATVDEDRKLPLLLRLLAKEKPNQAIVFTRTKRGADRVHETFARRLKSDRIAVIHGDLPQRKRDSVIKKLRSGQLRMLIATDVVGRGIDVSSISHIINYDIPEYSDDYVHRVGRTGRMSSEETGRAITFVTLDQGDQLTNIEMRINGVLAEYTVENFEAYRSRKRVKREVLRYGI